MDKYYTIGEVSKIIGVTVKTLRRWEESGKLIPDARTAGKHRRYSESQIRNFLGKPLLFDKDNKKVILYARVNSWAQKDELDNQIEALKQYTIASGQSFDDVWSDYGSGLNYKRGKLTKLVNLALSGQLDKVVITHKDRLVRFGYELIEDIFNKCGAQIVIINRSEKPDFIEELAKDLRSIVQDFYALLYDKRSSRYKKGKEIAFLAAQSLSKETFDLAAENVSEDASDSDNETNN